MYSGNIVEYARTEDLFKNPQHPYTQGLMDAIPRLDSKKQKLNTIRGSVPNLIYPPSRCRFHPRCDYRLKICDKMRPSLNKVDEDYFVACHLYDPKFNDSPPYEWSKEELEKTSLI